MEKGRTYSFGEAVYRGEIDGGETHFELEVPQPSLFGNEVELRGVPRQVVAASGSVRYFVEVVDYQQALHDLVGAEEVAA